MFGFPESWDISLRRQCLAAIENKTTIVQQGNKFRKKGKIRQFSCPKQANMETFKRSFRLGHSIQQPFPTHQSRNFLIKTFRQVCPWLLQLTKTREQKQCLLSRRFPTDNNFWHSHLVHAKPTYNISFHTSTHYGYPYTPSKLNSISTELHN